MGTRKLFVFNTHFDLVNMGSVNQFLYRKIVLFAGSFWFSASTALFSLLGFLNRYLFRLQKDASSHKHNSNNDQSDSNCIEPEPEAKPDVIEDSEYDGFGENETPNFCLKFKFQTYEEFSRSNEGSADSVSSERAPTSSTNKYEFMSGKGFSGFMEEPEVVSFTIKESHVDSNDGSFGDNGALSEKDFMGLGSEADVVHEEIPENSTNGVCREEVSEKLEATTCTEDHLLEKGQANNSENNSVASNEVQFLSEKDFFVLDSDSESISSSHEFSVLSHLIDSSSDGFLSDTDFGGAFEFDSLMGFYGEKIGLTDDFDEEDRDIMEELEKLEEPHLQNSGILDSEMLHEKDFHGADDKSKREEFGGKDDKPKCGLENSEKPNSHDSEDSNGLETLWEHQELIEQLKMELKKVRATGLPTILEESESPKIMEDLKPWKIDEKFQREDRMGELHKFYKSYRERMRKFDILNYQKMYAIGFLQLKDPLQSISSDKSSVPAITSLLSQNFRPRKCKKSETDPMMKFVKELQSELEVVYVGQACLSWEFLHWQYGKALELWESDPRGIRRYNEVAGEFQQFQVLMQRFIEDEPFQGPRTQNYIKNRCILRNLLQVPVIRGDSLKDKKKARIRGSGDDVITSDMLVEIMEESIRIFWRFVRADKDSANVILKGGRGTKVELQDPADSELLKEIQTNLQKKEKKLKDILRSGNCILRRFQKHQEDSSDQVLYFFSQVDLKLVARVLNMSRITTDQLVWCRNKLSQISFVNKKIHVEPSFLLFPC